MITAMLIVRRIISRPPAVDQSPEVIADPDDFIRVINRGSTMGKLKMAISEKLFPALEAMAATMVSTEARPRLPSTSVIINKAMLITRFPINSTKKPNESVERMNIRIRLYMIFDITIFCGLVIV